MSRLDTVVSSVGSYADQLSVSYTKLTGDAETIRNEVATMKANVDKAERAVSDQVYKAQSLEDEAQQKESYYRDMMDRAEYDVRCAQEQVDYVLNHPITVTETDSDGNTTTHTEIDHAALAAAQSELSRAQAEYSHYSYLHGQAAALVSDAGLVVKKFEAMHKAIQTVGESIEEERRRIEQYSGQIREEANHNLISVGQVYDRMLVYLACKGIFRP